MLHGRNMGRWIAGSWLLAGCNIDTLWAEFHATEPPQETTSGETGSGGVASTAGETGGAVGSGEASTTSGGSTAGAAGTATTGAADTGETTAGSESGEPAAVCGDGVAQPGEECDDGDVDELDGCTSTCARARLVFVTSELITGGKVDGLEGGDARCRSAAAKAFLPNPTNFKALLSDSGTDARDRLFHGAGPYRLVNGLQVARDFTALMNETLEYPIDTTETGSVAYPGAWTGTQLGGIAVPGDVQCKDWHSASILDLGVHGRPTAVDAEWLDIANLVFNPTDCLSQLGLYCLEQQ